MSGLLPPSPASPGSGCPQLQQAAATARRRSPFISSRSISASWRTAGSQYTSIAYTDRLDEIGAAPSIGTVADSYDNAMAESTNALYKTELHRNPAALAANGGAWKGLDDLEVATCGWVSWFNTERLHGQLDDRTPAEVEAAYHRAHPRTDAA